MINYPLTAPTSTVGYESIEFRAVNAVVTSQSPFTYKQQVFAHQGQRWEASVNIPSVGKDLAADWKSFLVALKGQTGTFLLGDPDYRNQRGDVSSCTLTGTLGQESVSVVMTGTLKSGDYIQLGTGQNARLHTVLQDQTGDGTLEIWPGLRDNYTAATVTFTDPKGVFRLRENMSSYSINNDSRYGISFEAIEVIV